MVALQPHHQNKAVPKKRHDIPAAAAGGQTRVVLAQQPHLLKVT